MVQVSGGQLITSSGQPIMVQAMSGGQGQTIMQVPVSGTQGLQQVRTHTRTIGTGISTLDTSRLYVCIPEYFRYNVYKVSFHNTVTVSPPASISLVLRSSWCSRGRSSCREGRRCSCRGSRVRPSRSSSSSRRPPLLQDRTRFSHSLYHLTV